MASKKKDTVSGEEAFELYYSQQYGTRWSSLKDALKKDTVYFSVDFSSDECSLEKYFLDPGSICSALCLPVKNAEKLLDLCAAPGGKTLILSGTREKESVLYSNERSPQRKERLVKVVKDSLPPSLSDSTKISCSDGAVWCRRETESFDSILLDVPCSSERHVLNNPKYLCEWTPSRIKTISMEQWALLSGAWRLLKKGCFLLYSTCALAEKENDGTVEKLLKKYTDAEKVSHEKMLCHLEENISRFSGQLTDVSFNQESSLTAAEKIISLFKAAEKTEHGLHILPDISQGAGPLYFSLLYKRP